MLGPTALRFVSGPGFSRAVKGNHVALRIPLVRIRARALAGPERFPKDPGFSRWPFSRHLIKRNKIEYIGYFCSPFVIDYFPVFV